jgi:hypothetical protein
MKYLICLTTLLLGALTASEPTYPEGFRGWVHVKSAIITAAHPAAQSEGGIHHIYANAKAVAGYSNGSFPEGAVIVYELVQTSESGAVISEGARRRVDVMVKDSSKFKTTGGWGFHRFMGSSQTGDAVGDAAKTMCFDCHARATDHGFVFSRIRQGTAQ